MTFGICVLACRPVSVSSWRVSGSSSARCEKRCARARYLRSPVIAKTSASTSFMPPCSAPSICCICSSDRSRQQFAHQSASAIEHLARLRVAADQIGVAQAGEQLVQVVPGHPRAVEAEALDLQSAGGDAGPQLAALRHAADVAVAVGPLALGELADHRVEPPLRLGVARRGPGLRQRGQVVAGRVALQAGALPVRIQLGLRLQARLESGTAPAADRSRARGRRRRSAPPTA